MIDLDKIEQEWAENQKDFCLDSAVKTYCEAIPELLRLARIGKEAEKKLTKLAALTKALQWQRENSSGSFITMLDSIDRMTEHFEKKQEGYE